MNFWLVYKNSEIFCTPTQLRWHESQIYNMDFSIHIKWCISYGRTIMVHIIWIIWWAKRGRELAVSKIQKVILEIVCPSICPSYGPYHMVHIIWFISYGPYHMICCISDQNTFEYSFDLTGESVHDCHGDRIGEKHQKQLSQWPVLEWHLSLYRVHQHWYKVPFRFF